MIFVPFFIRNNNGNGLLFGSADHLGRTIIVTLICFILGFFVLWHGIEFFHHTDLEFKDPEEYRYGTLSDFKSEFGSKDWKNIGHDILSDYETNSSMYGSIIKFNGINMVLRNPFDFWQAQIIAMKYLWEHPKKNEIKEWGE